MMSSVGSRLGFANPANGRNIARDQKLPFSRRVTPGLSAIMGT